jgi:two-component system, OmpR family, response regulator
VRLLYLFRDTPDERLDKGLRELGHSIELAPAEAASVADVDPDAVIVEASAPSADLARRLATIWPAAFHIQAADRTTPAETAAALRSGADVCFARPLELREIAVRLEAAARRLAPSPLKGGRLMLDGEAISLSPREQAIVEVLARRPGSVLATREIGDAVWGADALVDPATVRAAISRLSARVLARHGWRIVSAVRGRGYRFDPRRVP